MDSNEHGTKPIGSEGAMAYAPLMAVFLAVLYAAGYLCAGYNTRMLGVPGVELPREKIIAIASSMLVLVAPGIASGAMIGDLMTGRIRSTLEDRFPEWGRISAAILMVLASMFGTFAFAKVLLGIESLDLHFQLSINSLAVVFVTAVAFKLSVDGRDPQAGPLERGMILTLICFVGTVTYNRIAGRVIRPEFGGPEMAMVRVITEKKSLDGVLFWIDDNSLVMQTGNAPPFLLPRSEVKRMDVVELNTQIKADAPPRIIEP